MGRVGVLGTSGRHPRPDSGTIVLAFAHLTQPVYQKKEKIIIVGNLGGDLEMRYTPSGKTVTNFGMVHSGELNWLTNSRTR
jgi:hypothetical protein